MSVTFKEGLAISNRAHRLEGESHCPKPIAVLIALILGALKPLFFIITTLCFALGFAGKSIYECACGRSGGKYAMAALLNLGGFLATIGFIGAAAFVMPFDLTCTLFFTAIAVSIIYHVVKAYQQERPIQA